MNINNILFHVKHKLTTNYNLLTNLLTNLLANYTIYNYL
jgi:hypothetical protein